MNFILDVSKWVCGRLSERITHNGICSTGEGESRMLNDEGYMCCLGQFSLQLGLSEDNIRNAAYPCRVITPALTEDGFPDATLPYPELPGKFKYTFVKPMVKEDPPGLYRTRSLEGPAFTDTELARELAKVNDEGATKLPVKIAEIRRLLEANGHTLKVINAEGIL